MGEGRGEGKKRKMGEGRKVGGGGGGGEEARDGGRKGGGGYNKKTPEADHISALQEISWFCVSANLLNRIKFPYSVSWPTSSSQPGVVNQWAIVMKGDADEDGNHDFTEDASV